MSNRPHRRRRPARMSEEQMGSALGAVRVLKGCTCSPDVVRRHMDGVLHVILEHDDWCPAATATSQIVIGGGHG
jgi:citrate synthase